MIKQVKFVSIPVADQNRALDFYTEKLGFTIITDQPFDEKQRWIELRIPKADTRVVLFTAEGEQKRIGSFMNMRSNPASRRRTQKTFAASFESWSNICATTSNAWMSRRRARFLKLPPK